jgi:hypothetical protein
MATPKITVLPIGTSHLRTFVICLVMFGIVGATWSATKKEPPPSPENVYGVIEIGASGIKAVVIQKTFDDPTADTPPTKTLKEYEPADKNAGNLEAVKSGRVVSAVSEIVHRMETDYAVPRTHLYLVGSSGLPAENRSLLSALTFSEGQIDFIKPNQEAILVFKGIVPVHRLNQVVVLDLGSGNSKGAYLESSKDGDFATYSMQFGTKSWAAAVNASRTGDNSFAAAADVLRGSKLLPAVRACVEQFPGMQGRRRVYLAGGTAWAMATLMHPDQIGANANGFRSNWVKLNMHDVDNYLKMATDNPGALLHPVLTSVNERNRKEAEDEVARVSTVFTQEQILAGAQVLKAFSDEMQFAGKDALFFSRRALYAWPHGYLLEKLSKPGADLSMGR